MTATYSTGKRNPMRRVFNFIYYVVALHLVLGATSILPNFGGANRLRGWLVKPFFRKCGKRFQLARGAIINMPRNIAIGDDVYIAHDAWINGTGGLTIGDNVIVSPKVVIATTRHAYENGSVILNKSDHGPIVIGNGTWIASHCTVTMNTTIGKGCIVGACSSVTRDLPDYVLAGGVPARVIKRLAANLNEIPSPCFEDPMR